MSRPKTSSRSKEAQNYKSAAIIEDSDEEEEKEEAPRVVHTSTPVKPPVIANGLAKSKKSADHTEPKYSNTITKPSATTAIPKAIQSHNHVPTQKITGVPDFSVEGSSDSQSDGESFEYDQQSEIDSGNESESQSSGDKNEHLQEELAVLYRG